MNGTAALAPPADASAGRRWAIVFLLFLIQVINFADKTVVGLAARPIMAELGISNVGYGVIASSFFSLYAVGGLLVGFLAAPRVRPRVIITLMLLVWSITQLPIVFAASLPTLIACRTVLGFAEGAGTPTSLNACHEWFADRDRNLPSAFVMFGSTAGSLIAAPVLSYIIALYGWRAAFLACGAAGMATMLLWFAVARDGPFSQFAGPGPIARSIAIPRPLWLDRTIIGLLLVGFCAYWMVGFSVAWLAPFVSQVLGSGVMTTGWLLSLIFGSHAVMLLSVSTLTQRMMAAGVPSRVARGHVMSLAMLGCAVAFAAAALVDGPWLKVVLIGVFAAGLPAIVFPLNAAMLSEIAPARYRNQLVTLVFSALTFSAVISPGMTGWLVRGDVAPDWRDALLCNGLVAFIGAVVGFALLDPSRSRERLRDLR